MQGAPSASEVIDAPISQRTPRARPGDRLTRDWAPVRRDYESGALGVGQTANKHGMSVNALCNKARRDGWTKPEKFVRKHAMDALQQAAVAITRTHTPGEAPPSVAALLRPPTRADMDERLGSLVRLTANVLLEHRGDIRELAHLTTGQLGELKAATYSSDRLFQCVESLLEMGVIDGDTAKDARRELRGICELKGRMVALGMLTAQFDRLQQMERQAFGIEQGERPEDADDDVAGILVEFVNAPGQGVNVDTVDEPTGRTARRLV